MRTRTMFPAAELIFALASVCVAFGIGFLLLTTGQVRSLTTLWPILPALFSSFWLYMILLRNGRKKFLFLSLLVFLYSLLLLLATVVPLRLQVIWPAFMVVAGLAILLPGFMHYRRAHPVFMVPATAFLIMGGFFSIFSFGFSSLSFRAFLSMWWPGLILAGGLFLFIMYFVNKSVYKFRLNEHNRGGGQGQ